jgi:hypothetical protein
MKVDAPRDHPTGVRGSRDLPFVVLCALCVLCGELPLSE